MSATSFERMYKLILFGFIWSQFNLEVQASVNLVLPTEEVRKLLGLNRELAYIRNGVVNNNAINFPIPVSSDLEAVHFLWFNPDPSLPVTYKLVINIITGNEETLDDSENAMHQPFVNISHSGQIPQSPTVWRVALPCSGRKEATVEIFIDLILFGSMGNNVHAESETSDKKSPPTTKLRLKRSKTCTVADGRGQGSGEGGSGSGKGGGGVWKANLPPTTPPHMLFLGALLSAIIVIVLLIICVVIIHMRSRNKMPGAAKASKPPTHCGPPTSATSTTTFMQHHQQGPQQHIYEPIPALSHPQYHNSIGARTGLLALDTRPESRISNFELRQRYVPGPNFEMGLMTDAAESRVTDWIQQQQRELMEEDISPETDPQIIFENLQADRIRLKLGSLLQEGTFGRVYQGLFECEDGSEQDVMIKTVLTGSSPAQSQMLIIEGVRLQSVIPAHKNLLHLLAATWDGTSPMLIYPYSAQGNFKQYLTKYASGGLSTHQVVRMGIHLLSAMGHLHKRGIIHKDIAARNCFMAEGPTLKLADSALSRDLFPNDYHCLGDNENRPIKWMPLEAIAQGAFSRASDIWSFGVVLWELMTRAQQPYPEIDPFEMETYLNEGYRLPQPLNCPDQLFSVLVSCWGTRPQERTSLQQLHQSLQSLQRQLQQFV